MEKFIAFFSASFATCFSTDSTSHPLKKMDITKQVKRRDFFIKFPFFVKRVYFEVECKQKKQSQVKFTLPLF